MPKQFLTGLVLLAVASVANAGNFSTNEADSNYRPPVSAADGGGDGGGRKLHIAPQISWGDNANMAVGGRVILSLSDWKYGFEVAGSFDVFFPGDDFSYFEINSNLIYNFGSDSISPYLGAGLNVARVSVDLAVDLENDSETDIGLNVLAGVKLNQLMGGGLVPYLEARYEIDGGEQFVLTGGISF